MLISEVYPCLQGEGELIGTPSILIRTSGCNLRCQWGETKCDTPFTSWEPVGETLSVNEIMRRVVEADKYCVMRYAIVSGGEPTLNELDLKELCSALKKANFHITIETNGTRFVDVKADLFSISPKLRSSVPIGTKWESIHERERINIDTLHQLLSSYDSYLKFVVASASDMIEVYDILKALANKDRAVDLTGRVYLMPEGRTKEEIELRQREVAELAQARGYRYSPRLHIDLYGDKRGV